MIGFSSTTEVATIPSIPNYESTVYCCAIFDPPLAMLPGSQPRSHDKISIAACL